MSGNDEILFKDLAHADAANSAAYSFLSPMHRRDAARADQRGEAD